MSSDDLRVAQTEGSDSVAAGAQASAADDAADGGASPSKTARLLGKLRCFADCQPDDLEAIARFTHLRTVPARQALFSRGDTCSHLYALQSGTVKLTRGLRDHEAVVDLLGPGAVFGEFGLFSDHGNAGTAITLSRCTLLEIEALPLLHFVQTNPRTAFALLVHMNECIGRLFDRVERHSRFSAEQVTAAHLLDHCDERGVVEPATAHCGRRILGSYLGLRPETVSRVLSQFRRNGWLRELRDGRQIVDRGALAARLPGTPAG